MASDDRFVNPYAFVPLPSAVVRRPPTMHAGQPPSGSAADLLSGRVRVRWTLATPLLLPTEHRKEGWTLEDGRVRLPGSSVRGATRSLHEAIFAGCLRVLDEDFVPAYRMTAREGKERWRLARVCDAHDGKAVSVQLCAEAVVWVDAQDLQRRWPSGSYPTTGDLVEVKGPTSASTLGRLEMPLVDSVRVLRRAEASQDKPATSGLPTGQLLLVTDTGARHPKRHDRSPGRASWAVGTLLDAEPITVSPDAQEDFARACAGSNDRRILESAKADKASRRADAHWRERTAYADVLWNRRTIARRAKASGYLFAGDAVWVRLAEDSSVDGIRLAQIWRHVPAEARSVGERLGPRTDTTAHSCLSNSSGHDDGAPAPLCLSCAVFGAADTKGDQRGRGRQTAYRGHVRFSGAESTTPVRLNRVGLAPMAAPNPGSGMFYLRLPSALPERRLGDVGTRWGGEADSPPAKLNGRKFYWHSDPDAQAAHWSGKSSRDVLPRYIASQEQRRSEGMRRDADLVPAGTTFEGTVTFDRLDAVALRSLIAALDPTAILRFAANTASGDYAVRLGGGKPLGLGSARVNITEVHVQRLGDRYLTPGQPSVDDEWTSLQRPHMVAFVKRCGEFLSSLKALGQLLDLDGLAGLQPYVTYPPGAHWQEVNGPDFRRSFEFFVNSNGEVLKRGVRPWHLLPSVRPGQDPSLPVELRPGRGGRG